MYIIIFFIQTRLRKDTNNDQAIVLAIILYSDSTVVTQNGRDSIWPMYMTLGNIPLRRRNEPGSFQLLGFLPQDTGLPYV